MAAQEFQSIPRAAAAEGLGGSCRGEAELARARQARGHRAWDGDTGHGTGTPGTARHPRPAMERGPGGSGPARKEPLPQGLEGMTCERRRQLNLHGGGASCLQGDVITGYKYLQGNNGDRDGELFTGARWQDTERARPGRRELAPGAPPDQPGCGASGQPGPGQPLCPELLGEGVRVPGGTVQPRGASSRRVAGTRGGCWREGVARLGVSLPDRGWWAGPASPTLVLSPQKGTAIR